MKEFTAICCLLLLTVGSVAAWAEACCPPDHEMMPAADECLAPAANVTPTLAPPQPAGGQDSRRSTVAEGVTHAVTARARDRALLGMTQRGDLAPPASRNAPVLLL
jgi:hypothetical protein